MLSKFLRLDTVDVSFEFFAVNFVANTAVKCCNELTLLEFQVLSVVEDHLDKRLTVHFV